MIISKEITFFRNEGECLPLLGPANKRMVCPVSCCPPAGASPTVATARRPPLGAGLPPRCFLRKSWAVHIRDSMEAERRRTNRLCFSWLQPDNVSTYFSGKRATPPCRFHPYRPRNAIADGRFVVMSYHGSAQSQVVSLDKSGDTTHHVIDG